MSHQDLVERAAKWIRNTGKCPVVLSEFVTYAREIPDAIGWNSLGSILIECKATRSDYLADKHKITRQRPEMCMGNFRFYMTPPGLVSPDEILEGWGLLEVHEKRVMVVKRAAGWNAQYGSGEAPLTVGVWGMRDERKMMFSALRRMELRGFLKHVQDPVGPVTKAVKS